MSTLIPILLPIAKPLISALIKKVEGVFGPKTGDTKLATVLGATKAVVDKLAAAGKIPGLPEDSVLLTLIETIFQDLKATGQLTDSEVQTITVPKGSKVTIEVP